MKAHYVASVVALQGLLPAGHYSGPGELRSAPLRPPSYLERDSTFNPDGSWEAVQWIRLGDLEISAFVLVTHDCSGPGACTPRSEPLAWLNAGKSRLPTVRTPPSGRTRWLFTVRALR
jgi:hypothetical protein